jgi:hypothetical protein
MHHSEASTPEDALQALNLQSMQVRQQIVNLLLAENLGVTGHLVASKTNDVGDPIVIRGHSAHRQVLAAEHPLHAGTLPPPRRVWRMAAVAIAVINSAPRDLLRSSASLLRRWTSQPVTGHSIRKTKEHKAKNFRCSIMEFHLIGMRYRSICPSNAKTNHYNNKAKPSPER